MRTDTLNRKVDSKFLFVTGKAACRINHNELDIPYNVGFSTNYTVHESKSKGLKRAQQAAHFNLQNNLNKILFGSKKGFSLPNQNNLQPKKRPNE